MFIEPDGSLESVSSIEGKCEPGSHFAPKGAQLIYFCARFYKHLAPNGAKEDCFRTLGGKAANRRGIFHEPLASSRYRTLDCHDTRLLNHFRSTLRRAVDSANRLVPVSRTRIPNDMAVVVIRYSAMERMGDCPRCAS